MAKEFTYRGKTPEALAQLQLAELAQILPSRAKRSIKRGFSEEQKKLLVKVRNAKLGTYKKKIRTHARDMIIIPDMFGLKIAVHNGKLFQEVIITPPMIGHTLGEFAETRRDVKHSGPGIGATRGSKSQSVK